MNIKKTAVILSALIAIFLSSLTQGACPKKACTRKTPATCRPSTCTRPVVKKKSSCCTRTTTYIIRKNKRGGHVLPPVPGHYHIHFERNVYSNSLERISVPYPTRTRQRQ